MDSAARQVCMPPRDEGALKNGGASQTLRFPREHFAPGVDDAVYQQIACFLHFKRTDQWAEAFLVGFGALRHKAESRMQMGAGFPEAFVLVL